jgi:phytoene dehydrogenase-like protein
MSANEYLVGMHWHDVIVVGAGHNGLTAALLFARKGLKVLVVEGTGTLGGGMRTERPFASAPELAVSTGAPLVGLLPPELLLKMGIELPSLARDPHTFVPTTTERGHITLGADLAATCERITGAFSEADARAYAAMQAELSGLGADLAPAWLSLADPGSLEETADRYVRPALQGAFVAMCRGSARAYVDRWGYESERLRAVVSACDAPTDAAWDEPGSGAGLLLHHAAAKEGAWRIVQGGAGMVTRRLADQAVRLGTILETEAKVSSIVVELGVAKGVVLEDGTMHHATAVLCSVDPQRIGAMLGSSARPDAAAQPARMMALHLALRALPRFTSAPAAFERGDFAPTIHLMPDEVAAASSEARAAVRDGKLPASPAIAMHVHTGIDPSLRGNGRAHGATLFVNVPRMLRESSWDAEEPTLVKRLLATLERFAPGAGDLVEEAFVLTPSKIEAHFGARAATHPLAETRAFGDRLPDATGVHALYSCSAAVHPGGAVVGGAGHNAAMRVLRDLGKPLSVPPPT